MTILQVNGVDIVLEHNNAGRQTTGYITGQGNTFTYQVAGTGSATISGSNNGTDWIQLTDAPLVAPSSVVLIHSWSQIKVEGDASVIVSRG